MSLSAPKSKPPPFAFNLPLALLAFVSVKNISGSVLDTVNLLPSKVKFASPSNVFAVPDPVISLLSALLLIVVDVYCCKS